MAEIAAGLIGPIIEVVRWVGAPIVRQFNYLCCFTANITNLEHEAEELENVARGLQEQVNREIENLQVIVPIVDSWLTKSKDFNDQKNIILGQVPNVRSGCLKLRARFSLSKRAKKTIDRMKELRGQCNFSPISQQGPPAATRVVPLGTTLEFESRKRLEEDIMTTLRLGEKRMIGICGMGGLGKTTMAKRIMNRVLEEHMFEEAVIVVVSQPVDNLKIQVEIGGSLGLNLKDETWQARVQKLHARLSGTKRILLLLDDVWEGLELEELGVPCDSRGCTILITSRNSDVLDEMNVQMVFRMKVLDEEEAWFLFRERAGTCVDDSMLNSIAKEVVNECTRLPLALTTVGSALKDEMSASIWKDALRQLRQPEPDDTPNYIAKVYNPLKLSYDSLCSKPAKSLFLLCCLFPEDASIPLDMLTCYCMGLGIFEGIKNIEEARNRVLTLIKMLKSRSLLLDGNSEDHVRMHDVVRDVCIFIAKQGGHIGGNHCTWISSLHLVRETSELSARLGFPNLRLLLLMRPWKEFESDSAFLEGSRNLNVLCIQNNYSLTSLPHTTHLPTNLNTLVLDSCVKLKTISVVGELVNLEILICRGCSLIKELPMEMKRLKRLKLLELSWCSQLQTIGAGIISSLVGLEELKMRKSFNKWEAEDSELEQNARLRELEALTNLTSLEIEIEDPALAAEQMLISSKLQIFKITFRYAPYPFSKHPSHKKLSLWLEGEETSRLGDWLEVQLLGNTECLYMTGNGANNVELAKCQNIRWLELSKCQTMKNIVRSSVVEKATVFPSLEDIKLFSLCQLQQISDAPVSSTSFQNVSSIEICKCHCLRYVGKLSIAGNDFLPQLEVLQIRKCKMMEQVFLWSENTNPQTITKIFPKLKEVSLHSLPNLATFCQGIEGIEFPLLTSFHVVRCPKMTSIVSIDLSIGMRSNQNSSGGSNNAHIQHSSNFFCQSQKVSFGNLKNLTINLNPFCTHEIPVSSFNGLKFLRIDGYHGSMSLPSSIAKDLVNLETLFIWGCGEMVQVIEDDEKMASGGEMSAPILIFPKLLKLSLYDLPKMVSFCEWKCAVELPSLSEVLVQRCPEMKNFSLGFLAVPKLESFETDFNHDLVVRVNDSFDRLKKLSIYMRDEHPFYHHKLFMSLVYVVEELVISSHEGMSLFPASIAGATFNCRVLHIFDCDKMEKVIEDEEEVVSGAQRTLLFPYLEELSLYRLPRLMSFCEWTCHIELPSLRKVDIAKCPNLKHFSLGPLTTPNLEIVQIDLQNIGEEHNLNGALQQQYLARAKRNKKPIRIRRKGVWRIRRKLGVWRSQMDSSSTV